MREPPRDFYEPNNTPEQAFGPLISGQDYRAFGWDETDTDDYYYFTPTTTDQVTVQLTNIPVDHDSDLYVYNYYNYGEFPISGSTLTPNDTWAMITKYYYAGGARVAMNRDGVVYYLLSDHLGSTTITINSAGTAEVGELRYYAYGKTRYSSGTTPTDRRFTGQIEDAYRKRCIQRSVLPT